MLWRDQPEKLLYTTFKWSTPFFNYGQKALLSIISFKIEVYCSFTMSFVNVDLFIGQIYSMNGLAMILESLGKDHRQILVWMRQQLPLHTFVNNSNKSYKVIVIGCY